MLSGQLYSVTAQVIQFKVTQRRLITLNIHEDTIIFLPTQIILPHCLPSSNIHDLIWR